MAINWNWDIYIYISWYIYYCNLLQYTFKIISILHFQPRSLFLTLGGLPRSDQIPIAASLSSRISSGRYFGSVAISGKRSFMAVCQNLVPLVNIKIAGKWMFIPLKMVLIGIDPYPYHGQHGWYHGSIGQHWYHWSHGITRAYSRSWRTWRFRVCGLLCHGPVCWGSVSQSTSVPQQTDFCPVHISGLNVK